MTFMACPDIVFGVTAHAGPPVSLGKSPVSKRPATRMEASAAGVKLFKDFWDLAWMEAKEVGPSPGPTVEGLCWRHPKVCCLTTDTMGLPSVFKKDIILQEVDHLVHSAWTGGNGVDLWNLRLKAWLVDGAR